MSHQVKMHKVESSHVHSIGLSEGGDLLVAYNNDPTKRYAHNVGFDNAAFEKLLKAESIGKAIRNLGVKATPWEQPKGE